MGPAVSTVKLAMNTDYRFFLGNPDPSLHRIAEAGFTHVNWCHHWVDDYFYKPGEVKKISHSLRETGLVLLDLHASAGILVSVNSRFAARRRGGIALLKNRIEMCADLGGQDVVLHATTEAARYTLDAVEALCRRRGIRIALENLYHRGHAALLGRLLESYDPDFVGLCFDTGHANLNPEAPDFLWRYRDRLISLHINDNHGRRDDHIPPFDGSVDWENFIRILGKSAYDKALCLEIAIRRSGTRNDGDFLQKCHRAGTRLEQMRLDMRTSAPEPG